MNERIKELAEQALFESDFDDEQNIKITMDIFAELIVRECMEQVWYTREEKIDETIIPNIKARMAKHFEVEE